MNTYHFFPAIEARLKKRIIIERKFRGYDKCAICLVEMHGKMISYTPCSHKFHTRCLRTQLTMQYYLVRSCAVCRRNLTDASVNIIKPPTYDEIMIISRQLVNEAIINAVNAV